MSKKFLKITVHYEVTKKQYAIEIVAADSIEEAESLVLQRVREQIPEVLYYNSNAFFETNRPENLYGVQNIKITSTKETKRPSLTEGQLDLINKLRENSNYCIETYNRYWVIRDITKRKIYGWGGNVKSVSAVTARSLLRRGFLKLRCKEGLSKEEIQIQLALGTLEIVPQYILDEEKLKQFNYKKLFS